MSDQKRYYVEFDTTAEALPSEMEWIARSDIDCEVKIVMKGPAGGNPMIRIFPADRNELGDIAALRRARCLVGDPLLDDDDMYSLNIPEGR